jgi:AraC-like DNA-binding protein
MDVLHVATAGHLPRKVEWVHAAFPFDGLGIVVRGSGRYSVDGGVPVRVEGPAVFHVWPGARFRYGPDEGTAWEERYVCFTGPRVADWVRWGWLPRSRKPLAVASLAEAVALHEEVGRGVRGLASLVAAKLACERLVWVLAGGGGRGRARLPEEELMESWARQPPGRVDLRAEARKMGLSYSAFRQRFAARAGMGPYAFLLRARVDAACRELLDTEGPVKSVALAAGFRSVEVFQRTFRRLRGCSPGAFRRGVRGLRAGG